MAMLIAIGSVSCKKNAEVKAPGEAGDPAQLQQKKTMKIYAYSSESGKKTTMKDDDHLFWSSDDKLMVISWENFQSSQFPIVSGVGTDMGIFEGEIPGEAPYVAACPYNVFNHVAGGKSLKFTFPQLQTYDYTKKSFESGSMPCIAYAEDNTAFFRNLCGVLKLNITGSGKVKTIVIRDKATHYQQLWGTFTLSVIPSMGLVAYTGGATKIYSTAIVNCSPAAPLSSTPQSFYIVLPTKYQGGATLPEPWNSYDSTTKMFYQTGTLQDGFYVDVYNTEGQKFTIEAPASVNNTIIRSNITEMPAFEATFPTPEVVVDADGNQYRTCNIGEQVWLAENLKSTTYDTQSERAGEVIPYSSKTYDYTPFYIDGTKSDYSLDMELKKKFGFFYNYAALTGLEDGRSQTTSFSSPRQGICPNGYHVPSESDFNNLFNYFGGRTVSQVAPLTLKAEGGWTPATDGMSNGYDSFCFGALPCGYGFTHDVGVIHYYFYGDIFWMSMDKSVNDLLTGYVQLYYQSNAIPSIINEFPKYQTLPVRCLKNSN